MASASHSTNFFSTAAVFLPTQSDCELNKLLVGTIFPNKMPFEAVRSIPSGMNYFTMFDGLKEYHMIPLDEESMALTTFSTPFDLFQYTRLPMGINHAGDSFGSRYYQVFGDLPIAGCVEDMCVYAATYPEMLVLSRQIIERADKHNVSFNAKKTIGAFAVEEGDFASSRLNSKGYSPSPELTRAIREFPRPTGRTLQRQNSGRISPIFPTAKKTSHLHVATRPRRSLQ